MKSDDLIEKDKFIYDHLKRRYSFEHDRAANLENKASNLVGWIGLIISIITTGTGILFVVPYTSIQLNILEILFFIFIFILLLGSLFFSLLAYSVKGFDVIAQPPRE